MTSPTHHPPAPWLLHGSMWLTVLRLGEGIDDRHPAGTYGVALVDYREPSPLTYRELLVARRVHADGRPGSDAEVRGRTVTITDIWVDSPASLAGGRALWAIPKDLGDLAVESTTTGPLTRTHWRASLGSVPIVTAGFSDVSRLAPRVPFKVRVRQPGIVERPATTHVVMKGTAKALTARGRWHFASKGPLGFLGSARQLGTVALQDFRIHFG